MKIFYFAALILCLSIRLNAAVVYVNSEIGNDLKGKVDNSAKNPFKTIQQAINYSSGGDKIVIEGQGKNSNQLFYPESVIIGHDKNGLSILGTHSPVIDGSFLRKNDSIARFPKNAISILAYQVSVSDLTIKNFLNIVDLNLNEIVGAGIYCAFGTSKISIEKVNVQNCNWGIYFDGPLFCDLNKNMIEEIRSYKNSNEITGGIGIMLNPKDIGMEQNMIGVSAGNVIKSTDGYGICFGNNKQVTVDNSKIRNNQISGSKTAGLALLGISGIVDISKNTFTNNNSSIFVKGQPLDAWIGENTFKGATGVNEVETSSDYEGAMLYDIWRNNENQFEKETYAAVNIKMEIVANKSAKYIRTQLIKAKEDASKGAKVVTFTP
ncbi:MAG: hypothetical protein NT007_10335 [Candidatus Kapabacteria bacterium]|nr:hypothetical protein [Candidatus Kapabacteria bacterium]